MTDTSITIDVIKEVSAQLQALYGVASADLMPVILNAIRVKATFSFLATIVAVIFFIFALVKIITSAQKHLDKSKYGDNDGLIFIAVILSAGALMCSLIVGCAIEKGAYIVCPEAKIIDKVINN